MNELSLVGGVLLSSQLLGRMKAEGLLEPRSWKAAWATWPDSLPKTKSRRIGDLRESQKLNPS
jgi:hypothetical protein